MMGSIGVATDFTCMCGAALTVAMLVGEKMVKIYAWYDNEAGYSMRTAELARLVARKFL